VLARWRPERVISLGDGFHDDDAAGRLPVEERTRLQEIVAAHDWLWLYGNHDPLPPAGLGGRAGGAVRLGRLTFRHEPGSGEAGGEVAGHLHPKASVVVRGHRLSRPCFVGDADRLILPAFGSYAGGLDVRAPAIASLFRSGCTVGLLGRRRVYPMRVVTVGS